MTAKTPTLHHTTIHAPELRSWHATPFPIIGVGGSRGKTTVTFMLADILRTAGLTVGCWNSAGVFLDDTQQEGELQPWSRLLHASRHGEVDVLVQELPSSTVVAAGLPPDTLAMAVLTTLCGNADACLLTPESMLDRRALENITHALHAEGTLIIGADDHDVAEIAASSGRSVFPVALHRDHPLIRQTLAAQSDAIWMDDRRAMHGMSMDDPTLLIDLRTVAATHHGTLLFQVQNVMLAAAAALRLGVEPDAIRRGLTGWATRPDRQPGACTMLRINEATVIIDQPRQMQSLRGLLRSLRHVPHRRAVCIIGPMAGMHEVDLVDATRNIADAAGLVILHGATHEPQRMARIRAGLAQSVTPPFVIPAADEARAIDYLLNTLQPNDLAVVLTDEPVQVVSHLWPAPRISVESTSVAGVVRSTQP